jgi:transcriptional regulator with XRE-family HTH domain
MKTAFQPGDQIRVLREARRLSRPQLAARASVSRAHLWHLEKNQMMPGLVTLEKIAAALDVGLSRFFIQPDGLLLEDSFVQKIQPFLPRLNSQQRELLLRTLQAAPKSGRPL